MKKFYLFVFAAVCCLSTILLYEMQVSATEVQGIISEDTVWNDQMNPIQLTGNVLVDEGATLTVNPGVQIETPDSSYILVRGKIDIKGTDNNPVTVNNLDVTRNGTGIELQSGGNKIEYCNISNFEIGLACYNVDTSQNYIINCYFFNNNRGISIDTVGSDKSGVVIDGCMFKNNDNACEFEYNSKSQIIKSSFVNNGRAIYVFRGKVDVKKSSFVNNEYGIYLWYSGGNVDLCVFMDSYTALYFIDNYTSCIVTNSELKNNQLGIFINTTSYDDSYTISNNTFTDNRIGINILKFIPKMNDRVSILQNNFNNIQYNIMLDTKYQDTLTLECANNYWGTQDIQEIRKKNKDYYSDFSLTKVNFEPFLAVPYNAGAISFSKSGGAYDMPITVALSAIGEGYDIFYTLDGSDPRLTSGIKYTSEITLTNTTVLKAVSKKEGVYGEVAAVEYKMKEKVLPYTIQSLNLKSMSGDLLSSVPAKGDFIAEVEVKKNLSKNESDYLIIASYDARGALIGYSYLYATMGTGQTAKLGTTLNSASTRPIRKIKAFSWDNLKDMTPLSNVKEHR